MAGNAFSLSEVIDGASGVQKFNTKSVFKGTGSEIGALSGNDGPFASQVAFCSSTGGGFTVNHVYVRNAANSAFVEFLILSGDSTVTGDITFDNDPGAPFIVTSGSAVVPNLDADLLDGSEGSFYQNATNLNAGTVAFARLPGISLEEFFPASMWDIFAGATRQEGSTVEGAPFVYILLNAAGERAKLEMLVPPGVGSVTATLIISGQGAASDADLTTRATDEGEDFVSGGSTDGPLAITDNTGSNDRNEIDVTAAFNGAGMIVAGDILAIEIRNNSTPGIGIIGIKMEWDA